MERQFTVFHRDEGGLRTIQGAQVADAEIEANPWLGMALLSYRAQDNGLPQQGELQRVGDIEDQLVASLRDAIHAGHVAGSGEMGVVFYAPSKGPDVVSVRTGFLKKTEVPMRWRQDPDWSLYNDELRPTRLEKLEWQYQRLWEALAANGDNHDIPRQVDFTANFRTIEHRTAFAGDIVAHGFEAKNEFEDDDGRFWCELVKTTAVSPSAILPECVVFDEVVERHGGVFDGWACHVQKS
jgi:hypothetical protein